jgi:hypothetical protein
MSGRIDWEKRGRAPLPFRLSLSRIAWHERGSECALAPATLFQLVPFRAFFFPFVNRKWPEFIQRFFGMYSCMHIPVSIVHSSLASRHRFSND